MPGLTAQDFKRLQWNLVFLLLLLGIGGGVVALTVQKGVCTPGLGKSPDRAR